MTPDNSKRDKFLLAVWRKLIILGHEPEPFRKVGWRWQTRCTICGMVVNLKVHMKLSDLVEEPCPGHRIDTETLRCSCRAAMCQVCGGCSKQCKCSRILARIIANARVAKRVIR